MVCYVYPSFAWQDSNFPSPYTIGFKTEKVIYDQHPFVNDYNSQLNSITRNTQLNIYATLSRNASANIDFEVVDWISEEVDVPAFN